mmetsp:Transcript_11920/g.11636  ORF Transcript_11920/g.11636 Transcript_11920/m.11636 type:complete len:387 (+) Transcript_11920:66-1226(+)
MASSTAVVNIMAEDDDNLTFDGILIQILTFVEPLSSSVGQQRITNDTGMTTIMPRKSQDDIINCTLVSKRFHQIISNYEENGTKKWNVIPVFEISPPMPSSSRVSSLRRLFNKLRDMSLNAEIIDNKQHFRHLIVNNNCEINHDMSSEDLIEMYRNGRNIRLHQIRSIQLFPSSTPRGNAVDCGSLVCYLLTIAPNVREIDVSSNSARDFDWGLLDCLATNIETIRWDNIPLHSSLLLNGFGMSNQNNLKQICMDESIFYCDPDFNDKLANYEAEEDDNADNNNNNDNNNDENDDEDNVFIFHHCCEKLERVSIRNAQYVEQYPSVDDFVEESVIVKCVTQKALIKFVRNAPPTLQWFRSNLSSENREMLQQERYEMRQSKLELLN